MRYKRDKADVDLKMQNVFPQKGKYFSHTRIGVFKKRILQHQDPITPVPPTFRSPELFLKACQKIRLQTKGASQKRMGPEGLVCLLRYTKQICNTMYNIF